MTKNPNLTPAAAAPSTSSAPEVPDSSSPRSLEKMSSSQRVKAQMAPDTLEKGNSTRVVGFSNRDTEAFKWQRARGVVGALEVKSEPNFKYREELIPHSVKGREKVFEDAHKAWEDLNLRQEFVEACDSLPRERCCCGLLRDHEGTKKEFVNLLNENWMKTANKKLLGKGLKIDCFLWNWQNASGKAETNILLIRFIELSSSRFRRASADDQSLSLDFDFDIDENKETEEVAPKKKLMAR